MINLRLLERTYAPDDSGGSRSKRKHAVRNKGEKFKGEKMTFPSADQISDDDLDRLLDLSTVAEPREDLVARVISDAMEVAAEQTSMKLAENPGASIVTAAWGQDNLRRDGNDRLRTYSNEVIETNSEVYLPPSVPPTAVHLVPDTGRGRFAPFQVGVKTVGLTDRGVANRSVRSSVRRKIVSVACDCLAPACMIAAGVAGVMIGYSHAGLELLINDLLPTTSGTQQEDYVAMLFGDPFGLSTVVEHASVLSPGGSM